MFPVTAVDRAEIELKEKRAQMAVYLSFSIVICSRIAIAYYR